MKGKESNQINDEGPHPRYNLLLAARECEPPGTQNPHRILRQRNDRQTAFCIPSSQSSRVDRALNSSAIHSGPHNALTLRRDPFQPQQIDNPSRTHEFRTRSRLAVAVRVQGPCNHLRGGLSLADTDWEPVCSASDSGSPPLA
jgi:hypothetical protein